MEAIVVSFLDDKGFQVFVWDDLDTALVFVLDVCNKIESNVAFIMDDMGAYTFDVCACHVLSARITRSPILDSTAVGLSPPLEKVQP